MSNVWSDRLQISQQPDGFEFPRRGLPKHIRFVGPLQRSVGTQPVPFPWERLDGRPLIYASLGTLQNRIVRMFRVIAEACEGVDAQLVLSTGNGISPEALGKLPGNPVVVSYAPQGDLLRRSTIAVTHAGLNTVLDALGAGLPMVAIPVTNEQPGVAARVAWIGAGDVHSPQGGDSADAVRRGGPCTVRPILPCRRCTGPGRYPRERRGITCCSADRAKLGTWGLRKRGHSGPANSRAEQ